VHLNVGFTNTEVQTTSRGCDVIELFKIIKGIYDSTYVPRVDFMELSEHLIRTRGNKFKLIQHHCHYDLRKFNFTNQVIPIWSSLSNRVVSADTVNTFKDRLDNFWSTQEVMYMITKQISMASGTVVL